MTRTQWPRVVVRALHLLVLSALWVMPVSFAAVAAASSSRQTQSRAAAAAASDAVVTLTSGASVERTIVPGGEQVFRVSIAQGEVLRVAVDQLGADVSVVLQVAGEKAITIDDESKHRYGRELSVWEAPAGGDVTLTVRGAPAVPGAPGTQAAQGTSIPRGGYRLSIAILPPGEALARAMTTRAEALRLSREAQGKHQDATVQTLREAVDAWRAYGDRELLAQSLTQLGRFQMRPLQRPADCVATMNEALAIYEALALPAEIAWTLGQIGDAQLLLGAKDEGRATFERAYTYADAVDTVNRGIIEDELARASTDAGDFDRGVMFGQRAIETFRAAGARRDEFLALERLAQTYQRMRRFDDALRTVTEAIPLAREHGRDNDLAALTRTLGLIHQASGDTDTALATFHTALGLFKDNPPSRLATMLSIGRLYNQIGDAAQARDWLEKTLAAVPPQLRDYWAAAAGALGSSLTALGEPARALDLQRKAVDLVTGRSTIGELSLLPGLGETCRVLGDLECARKATARAGEVAETFPGRPYEAIVLRERARDARAAGDLPQARQDFDAALDVIESERRQLRSQALSASFGGLAGAYYDEAIDLAMQMHAAAPGEGHDVRAFELFERSRARSLTDLLAEAKSDIRSGVDPALVAEQRALQTQLGQKDTALRELTGKSSAKERDRASILDQEIADITTRLAVLDARIRETSPRYAALTHPAPLSLRETQQLLDDETVLLAFSSGQSRSQRAQAGPGQTGPGQPGWAWAITRDALRAFPLPASQRIEEMARKVYDGLAARQRHVASDGRERLARIDRDLGVDAAALSDAILGPIAGALHGEWRTRRLAIVATGPLEYIPFAALPAPEELEPTPLPLSLVPGKGVSIFDGLPGSPNGDVAPPTTATSATSATTAASVAAREWLVSTHELVQLPSASVLAQLRDDESRRSPSSGAVAVIADAVYSAGDPRVHAARPAATAIRTSSSPQRIGRGLERDGRDSGFRRLVFSRDEARAIARLASGRGVFEALDFKASLATMTSPAVTSARILHIASHGIVNSARPELSGLVLSLVDEAGRPREGVLRLYDVFNLKLSADLVVLSACQTGLGRQMKSEGLVGLSRGFMYAGAPRVVATLWQVDDVATGELMRRFYQGMLVRKLPAAAALRAAQEEMRTSSRWHAPYYWAGFTLIGDWR